MRVSYYNVAVTSHGDVEVYIFMYVVPTYVYIFMGVVMCTVTTLGTFGARAWMN